MAVLSKIREKSIFLILIIGLALFAFLVSGDDIVRFFSSGSQNSVGKINGEDIPITEFQARVQDYKTRFNVTNDDQATKAVWEEMVSERVFNDQLEKAGIVIGEKDVWNAIMADPSINSSPLFQNEAGLFDEELLKSYIAELREDDTEDGKRRWQQWVDYDRDVAKNVKRQAYFNAVAAGMGYTSEEATEKYNAENTRVTGKYVYLPFNSIADSTISISEKEINNYVAEHKDLFKTKAMRDIRYVTFDILPSEQDKEVLKNELAQLIEDKTEYKSEDNPNALVSGFKNTEDPSVFVAENSDLPDNKNYIFKTEKPQDSLFDKAIGYTYGPYEEGGYYKISRIVEKKNVPEIKASHILIRFQNQQNPNTTVTKEEAQAKAESIMAKVKRGADFGVEAKTNSEDPGSAAKNGDLGWFKEGVMVPEFNDWCFSHRKGEIGMVETVFGFHIIKIMDTRTEPGLRLATVARLIEPSEATQNEVFIDAESFSSAAINSPKDFAKIAEERGLKIQTGNNLSRGNKNIPGLTGEASQVVYWTFEPSVDKGDVRRFDMDKKYVVAQLTGVQKEGIMNTKNAESKVRPILLKEKKSQQLIAKLANGTLKEIADANKARVIPINDATMQDAPGALSNDKSALAAMTMMAEGTILRNIVGRNGVYAVQLDSKIEPAALSSYEPTRVRMESDIRSDDNTIYNALKDSYDVGELKL
jgi:parvulin-like peptidyl-prolyl isomerase